ncbi:DUF5691 domain-containing protein [Chitinophaga barathri]|uniref:Uncharacterized protein n=1 Tax=Chitinophaga barathri TaxID=1647451 RepID=A0A3N4MU96_9BACT|nr:DUF5691 domain-containing protein [Chitinophaga barathri]RPD38993.1 hypothetical protein EG028_22920 [Chitinophaga barathri]
MKFWDDILNTAMLGTDKQAASPAGLPSALEEAEKKIRGGKDPDREEIFLGFAALILNYRQCGFTPIQAEQAAIAPAPDEEKPYCNSSATQALKDILSEDSIPLLTFWLQHCDASGKIVRPEMIPVLLDTGLKNKKLKRLISSCCGKRGEWLGRFNADWNYSQSLPAEEVWQAGTADQRKLILRETRQQAPAQAREWLQQTWAQEDAAAKTAFLELFEVNISADDIPFLESLSSEKSKKVKEQAQLLLKQIPGSAVVLQYQAALQQIVSLKKEKTMLGLGSKMALHFQFPVNIPEDVYKSGIEKLSNIKGMSDDEFIMYQLVRSVPPSCWEMLLGLSPDKVISFFQEDATGKKLIPSLVLAICNFKDKGWAMEFVQHSAVFYIDLLPLLPLAQQDIYSKKFFEKHEDVIIEQAVRREAGWDMELTKLIFRHIAKNPYQYYRSFFNQHIHLIPPAIVGELEKCAPAEPHLQSMWSTSCEYIMKLVSIKYQTQTSFS